MPTLFFIIRHYSIKTLAGIMCQEGRGGEQDMDKAAANFAKAANGGHIRAIFQLGM
jgi:TPR repeat protein